MRWPIIAPALMLALAGCSGIPLLGGGGAIIYSSPEAGQLRGCADGIDVFTPGISTQALPGLLMGSAATLVATAEEGIQKCLDMLRALNRPALGM